MSTPTSPTLTCPKCHGAMRSYERNGVTLDQCTECRGIFLDRGELERLIDAEAAYYDDRPSTPQHQPAPRRQGPSQTQGPPQTQGPTQTQGQTQTHGSQAPSYAQPLYGAAAGTGSGVGNDAGQQRSGSTAHGTAPHGTASSASPGGDLGKLASEVFRQVSAARSSSSSSSTPYGAKKRKSFLDQLLG